MTHRTSEPLSALASAVEGGDWGAALTVLGTGWVSMVHVDKLRLWELLGRIPHSVLDERPELIRARTYLRTRLDLPKEILAAATPWQRLTVITDRLVEFRRLGQTQWLARGVATCRALSASMESGGAESAPDVRAELRYQWGLAREESSETADALEEYEQAYAAAVRAGSRRLRLLTGGRAAYLAALHGDNVHARELLAAIEDVTGEAWWFTSASVSAQLARSLVLFDGLDQPGARRVLAAIDRDVVRHRWPSYFLVKAIVEAGPHRSRALATEFEAWRRGLVAAELSPSRLEYVRLIRYIHFAAEKSFPRARDALEDQAAVRGSSVLVQLAEGLHAADLLRTGRPWAAQPPRAVLLDSFSPRVVLLAALANPAPTSEDLLDAVRLAQRQAMYWPLRLLPPDVRARALLVLEELGEGSVAAQLSADRRTERVTLTSLSRRERAVADRAATGESVAEIARALHVSPNTVKSQLRSAFRKLGVSSRSQLFDVVHRLDAVDVDKLDSKEN